MRRLITGLLLVVIVLFFAQVSISSDEEPIIGWDGKPVPSAVTKSEPGENLSSPSAIKKSTAKILDFTSTGKNWNVASFKQKTRLCEEIATKFGKVSLWWVGALNAYYDISLGTETQKDTIKVAIIFIKAAGS